MAADNINYKDILFIGHIVDGVVQVPFDYFSFCAAKDNMIYYSQEGLNGEFLINLQVKIDQDVGDLMLVTDFFDDPVALSFYDVADENGVLQPFCISNCMVK